MMAAAKTNNKSTAAVRVMRVAPWESPPEPDEAAGVPRRGKIAVQHKQETRGRRSERFPDLNIGATAAKLGVTKQHLSKVLAGQSRPSIELAQKIADVLDKDLIFVASLFNNQSVPQRRKSKTKVSEKRYG